ncbi:MAG: hypothetical protein GY754_17775 [bacterium]|nr:hypothetical protein [bacterium]
MELLEMNYLIPIVLFIFLSACYLYSCIPDTPETEIYLKDDITYSKKTNKPFHGKSVFLGDVVRKGDSKILGSSDGWYGKRVTYYNKGNKKKEIVYVNKELFLLGIFSPDFFPFTIKYKGKFSIAHYKNNVKNGLEKKYHHGGPRIFSVVNYTNGKKNGILKEYHWHRKKGKSQIERLIEYKNGIQTGVFKTFKEDGTLDQDYIHDNGAMLNGTKTKSGGHQITIREWYKDGKLIKRRKSEFGHYKNECIDGGTLEETWYSNGKRIEHKKYWKSE